MAVVSQDRFHCTLCLCLGLQVCGGEKPYLMPDMLEREHMRVKQYALLGFEATRKMGGPEFSRTYREKLDSELDELYSNFQKHNDSKNIFAAARTPAVLFSVMVICYVLAGLFGVLGMESFANICNTVMGLALVLFVGWAYVRYSGEYREIGSYINAMAEGIWEVVSDNEHVEIKAAIQFVCVELRV